MGGASPKDDTLEEIDRLIDRRRSVSASELLPELNGSFAPLALPRFPLDTGRLQALEQKNEFLAVDLAAKSARLAALETELVAVARAAAEAESAGEDQLVKLKVENADLRAQLSAYLNRAADAQQRLESLLAAKGAAEASHAEKLAKQRELFEKKLERARDKTAAEHETVLNLQQINAGLSQKMRRAETELGEMHLFFQKHSGLVAQLDPPVRLRKPWTQFKQKFDAAARAAPPRAESRGTFRPAPKASRLSAPRAPVPGALNRSVVSQRSVCSQRSAGSVRSQKSQVSGGRHSRRTSTAQEAEAVEADIVRREEELARVKAQYKQLLFSIERTDPLVREKASFFAREVQGLSRELLELRKRQRQLFSLEYIK